MKRILPVLFAIAGTCDAATPSAQLQSQVRAATFEVVVPKPADGAVKYERPLPLELIPFVERNDKYWSVGTAFAIAGDKFVSAGHVINLAVGGLGGDPALRDSAGRVYPITQFLSYSGHEDFAVFSVAGLKVGTPLETMRTTQIDTTVYAVGNALGDGVVIRDGLLTSLTPEDQDGRWKWLRYSAATSPGNSGGPLLDADGRVIGVVIGKSAGENLNYALPIEHVLDAPAAARFDVRFPLRVAMLRDAHVANYDITVPLPLGVREFTTRVQAETLRAFREERSKLLAKNDAELLPRGKSDKLLGSVKAAFCPLIAVQDSDHVWELDDNASRQEVDLPNGGHVWSRASGGVATFELRRGDSADPAFYADKQAVNDLLVKGLKLTRQVGSESIPLTSLGAPVRSGEYRDRFGRRWQLAVFAMPFVDIQLVELLLPTPSGFSGVASFAGRGSIESVIDTLQFSVDYFYASLRGSVAQWQTYLARDDLRPASLAGFSVKQDATGLHVRSKRIDFDVPAPVLKVDTKSSLDVQMTYVVDAGKLAWDVGAVYVNADPDYKRYVAFIRQPKPGADAGKDIDERWAEMLEGTGAFTSERGHDADFKTVWRRAAIGAAYHPGAAVDPKATFLYEALSYATAPKLPREIDDMQELLLENVRIKER